MAIFSFDTQDVSATTTPLPVPNVDGHISALFKVVDNDSVARQINETLDEQVPRERLFVSEIRFTDTDADIIRDGLGS